MPQPQPFDAPTGRPAATAVQPGGLDAADRDWIASRFAARWGAEPEGLELSAVASRTGSVVRASAVVAGARQTTFVKRCAPRGRFASLDDYFDALSRVMAVVAADTALAPLDIVGIHAARGLLMTAAMPGVTLASVVSRRGALAGFARPQAPLSTTFAVLARYLARLHGAGQQPGTGRAVALGEYTAERLAGWADADPQHAPLAHRAMGRLDDLVGRLDGREPPLVLCHGDVTPENVLLGDRLGLIDWDDLRWDFPAGDLSQVLLSIGHLSWLQRLHAGREACETIASSFRAACCPWPERDAWQLAHLRNLAVYLITLARRRRTEYGWARYQTDRQYTHFIGELTVVVDSPPA
jgi:aminoglycoside phosphotransferase (APT) family kinase protein